MVYKYLLGQIHSSDLFFWVGFIYCVNLFFLKKLYGHFLWMGFNCLKAKEPLRGGALLLTTKLPSIFTTKLLNSHILIANSDVMFSAIWYHLYNLKHIYTFKTWKTLMEECYFW